MDINRLAERKVVLGFVILSHTNSPMLARLIATLNRIYDNPPIVIHHDFSQSPLPLDQHGNNVLVVEPHYRTWWGHITLVEAFLTALEILFEKYVPDWFVLLSTACYPVMAGGNVLDELARSPYDAYLDYKTITLSSVPLRDRVVTKWKNLRGLPNRHSPQQWINHCYNLYVSTVRPGVSLFSKDFECFAGDHWFTANSRVAKVLIASRRERETLFRHYCHLHCPEESFYQTVLCNERDLRICPDNKRFAEWSLGGAHPKELTEEDLPKILKSGCHFARKFSAEKSVTVLDALDRRHFASNAGKVLI
jgi:hypothetical protein